SGDVTGEYGRFTLIEKGMGATWFICASHLTTDYPQVSVSIKDGAYNGPGTYELIDGVTGKIMVAASEEATYNSYNVANNCAAVFTSESEFTFSCENLEMIQGQGSVSISSGVFSVKP
ncbi:MAG: hypothetical protein JW841_16080, partial [Deltaproteobacteria bacterium]|nr:hypothetical protein [Deltaproteobacteria bacterium]